MIRKKKAVIKRDVFINKKTGQASVTIPKKEFFELFDVDRIPKSVEISIKKNKKKKWT